MVHSARRRRWLRTAAAAAGSAALPAALAKPAPSGDTLHERVARAAAARAAPGGRDAAPLRLLLPSGSGANLTPVIRAFERLAGVRVAPIEIPFDQINAQLALDAMSGEGDYDVALPASFGVPDLVAAGALRPIDDFAERHEPPGFREGVLYDAADRFDGNLYGFQCDGDTYLTFFHADLMEAPTERARYADRYGAELSVPVTWEELDRQMAFFHRPAEGRYGGLLFRSAGYLAWEWWMRLHAKGVWPLSPDMHPQFASDPGVEALEQMIRAGDSLAPGSGSLTLFGNWERYARGDVYCNIGWGGSQKFFNRAGSAVRGRLRHGPAPGGIVDGQLVPVPYFNWGWSHVVTRSCSRAELAYLFALFVASPVQSTASVRPVDGYFDPFRPEHYADATVRAAYSDDFLRVHRDSLRNAIPDLYLAQRGDYFAVLEQWLGRALQGSVSPKEALRNVARRWEVITDRAGREAQQRRWQRLRARYPAATARGLRDWRA